MREVMAVLIIAEVGHEFVQVAGVGLERTTRG